MFEKKEGFDPRRPDFHSREGVSIWINVDKRGEDYATVKIPLMNISCNCFKPIADTPPEEEKADKADD